MVCMQTLLRSSLVEVFTSNNGCKMGAREREIERACVNFINTATHECVSARARAREKERERARARVYVCV